MTKDGRTLRGRRLNEDTYTVQIIDEQEHLLSLAKADLRELVVETDGDDAVVRGTPDGRRAGRRDRVPRVAEGAVT